MVACGFSPCRAETGIFIGDKYMKKVEAQRVAPAAAQKLHQPGAAMLRLLNASELSLVAGGPRGPVRAPGNGCTNTGNGGNACH